MRSYRVFQQYVDNSGRIQGVPFAPKAHIGVVKTSAPLTTEEAGTLRSWCIEALATVIRIGSEMFIPVGAGIEVISG